SPRLQINVHPFTKSLHILESLPESTTNTNAPSSSGGGSGSTSDTDSSKGQQGRKYQASWKAKFLWITYDAARNKVLCEVCYAVDKMHAPLPCTGRDMDSYKAFVKDGFCSWGKAMERFRCHEKSNVHQAAASITSAANSGVNVATALSAAKQKQMAEARTALMSILSSVQYLACQGLAIQGHVDTESNLRQLLNLRAQDIPELQSWLACNESKWLSHDILNEMTELFAHDVLRTLIEEIKRAEFFSIIMDETADIAVKEQVSVCFRVVTECLEIEELFIGFYQTASTTGDALFDLFKDVLLRLSLPIKNCRGQCYDGASNMSGIRNGLQARVKEQEPRALYVHCMAHVMNLVVQDVAHNIAECRNFMSLIRELITLIQNSPKRLAWFQDFQSADGPSLRPLRPTRWTVKAASLQSIASNYSALVEFLDNLSSEDKSDAGGKANGLLQHLQKFSTFFSLELMLMFFLRAETANRALQHSQLHSQKALQLIELLREDIKHLRENGFEDFWKNTTAAADVLNVEGPALPRPRKTPRRLDDGRAQSHSFQSPEAMYRRQFYQVMDTATSSLDCRFSQAAFKHMCSIEDFVTGKGDCGSIVEFHGDDLDKDAVDFLKGEQGELLRTLLPELTKLIRLGLTVPVTSCTSERSFSGLRRLKTYLRATMGQGRLNHLAVLNCHKNITRSRHLDAIADDFITHTAVRKNTFLLRK
uniref:TTF-type domain-containing protein n=1 Tax=Seriola dumerili TaxID=41447 RepID=A0A3B4UR12_SERDU